MSKSALSIVEHKTGGANGNLDCHSSDGSATAVSRGVSQLVGQAPVFAAILSKLPRIAACDAAVLLTGETGTGKEMCARALHYLSPRAGRSFVPVNCGLIPTELFENELFGHERGAFTDAREARVGLVAEAEGGTLFLDEVEALSPAAQVKLLRFLQDREYKPLGASRYRRADVRVIAATNEDLERRVRERTFREDLYYRLKVVSLLLPPLRDRREDIIPLTRHFLALARVEYRRPEVGFSEGALAGLAGHSWRGNVRELENVVRQAVVLATDHLIRANELLISAAATLADELVDESLKAAKARVVAGFERSYLIRVLAECGGNISAAARRARKNRRAFFALLKKYDVTRESLSGAN